MLDLFVVYTLQSLGLFGFSFFRGRFLQAIDKEMVKIGLLDSDSEDDTSQASPMVLRNKSNVISSNGKGKGRQNSTPDATSTRISLKGASDESVDNDDDRIDEDLDSASAEMTSGYELKPSVLQMQMSTQHSVYVPDGVDPAFIKKAQTLFSTNRMGSSSSGSSSTLQRFPPSGSPSNFSDIAEHGTRTYVQNMSPIHNVQLDSQMALSPIGLKIPNPNSAHRRNPGMYIDRLTNRPPPEFINNYMKDIKAFYSVDESPCLKILKKVKQNIGSPSPDVYTNMKTKPKRPVDYALSMGRSFRVGWTNTGQIVHAGKSMFKAQHESGGRFHGVVIENVYDKIHSNSVKDENRKPNVDIVKSCLDGMANRHIMMSEDELLREDHNLPGWQLPRIDSTNEYLQFIVMLKDLLEQMSQLGSKDDLLSDSWTLLKCIELIDASYGQEQALIDRIANGSDTISSFIAPCEEGFVRSDIKWLRRREYLSQWLESLVRTNTEVERIKSPDPFREIFNLLSLHMVYEAAEVAEDSGNYRLASLVSQAGGDEQVKVLIQSQLLKWMEMGAIPNQIPTNVLEIYRLISGDVLESNFGDTLLKSKDMTWAQAIGMLFWYSSACNEKLSFAIEQFEVALAQGDDKLVPVPHVRLLQPSKHTSAVYSLLISLFRNHNNEYVDALKPGGFSVDPLDYQGPLCILSLLESLGKIRQDQPLDSNRIASCIVRQHAISQLLSQGHWAHAIYIAMQMVDQTLRKSAVKFILQAWTGYSGWENNADDFDIRICKVLEVPDEWIHEAVAIRIGYDHGQPEVEIGYLKLAGKWIEAGVKTCQMLVSRYLHEDVETLYALLEEIEGQINSKLQTSESSEWNEGGKVVLEYLKIKLKRMSNEEASRIDVNYLSELLNKTMNLQLWMNGVGNVEISLGRVCKHEMCTTIVGWIDSLRNVIEQQRSMDLQDDIAKNNLHPTLDALLEAPIFPDRKLMLLQKLSAELMSTS